MSLVYEYRSPQWAEIAEHGRWPDFDALWSEQFPWFEEPNRRRDGWSGVARVDLDGLPQESVFIKKQENHNCLTLFHPVRGVPTYFREFLNLRRLRRANIGTLEVLYFGWRKQQGKDQAVLVTRALNGYCDLDTYLRQHQEPADRAEVLAAVAMQIARLHNRAYRYNALYGKHVFVKHHQGKRPKVRLIDAEGMRHSAPRFLVAANDLEKLFRRTQTLSGKEQQSFWRDYQKFSRIYGLRWVPALLRKKQKRKSN